MQTTTLKWGPGDFKYQSVVARSMSGTLPSSLTIVKALMAEHSAEHGADAGPLPQRSASLASVALVIDDIAWSRLTATDASWRCCPALFYYFGIV